MQETRKEALTTYVIENQEKFYRLAFSYVRDQQTAMDVVQDAVVKALEHVADLREMAYLRTWFYRILVNESLAHWNKMKREVLWEPEQMKTVLDTAQTMEEGGSEMYTAVMHLPPEMKTVVILRYYEDMTLQEIAQVTGASLSKVKYRLYTGLKKLRGLYEKEVAR